MYAQGVTKGDIITVNFIMAVAIGSVIYRCTKHRVSGLLAQFTQAAVVFIFR